MHKNNKNKLKSALHAGCLGVVFGAVATAAANLCVSHEYLMSANQHIWDINPSLVLFGALAVGACSALSQIKSG